MYPALSRMSLTTTLALTMKLPTGSSRVAIEGDEPSGRSETDPGSATL
jgi:hypothetical protein